MRRAIYPGSFDPTTNGHLDLIARAVKMFDEVVVAVAPNSLKSPLFSVDERMAMLKAHTTNFPTVQVSCLDGLRAVSDFEFEFQMALMNRKLVPEVETIFLMPKQDYTYLSSRIVKEIARLGGDVSGFVPGPVQEALMKKFASLKRDA